MQGNHSLTHIVALQALVAVENTRSLCGSTVLWKVLAYKGFQQFVGRIMRRYEGIGLSDQRRVGYVYYSWVIWLHRIDFYSHRMSFSTGDS